MGQKTVAVNRKAYHDYFIEEEYEAGIVLVGTEIKSLRNMLVQIKDAYISFIDGEAWIKDMYIPKYDFGNRFNHDETRTRKLLLHQHEIKKLFQKVKVQGYTIVPLSIYFVKGNAKIKIALAKGKHLYDKRNVEKEKSAKRAMEKAIKRAI